MSDIFESSLEEPPKRKEICTLHQLTKNLWKNTVSSPKSQQMNFVAKLGKVKSSLHFAVLLNDEDDLSGVDFILACCVGATSTCKQQLPSMKS